MKYLVPLLLLQGCFKNSTTIVPVVEPASTPTATPHVAIEVGAVINTVSLKCDDTCNKSQQDALPAIEAKINQTLSGDCFKTYFLSPERQFKNTLGLTPTQIVEKLRTPIKLTVNYYYKRLTKALGYEDATDFSIIHINGSKVGDWSTCDMASLAAHEMSHSFGFFHDGNSPSNNQNSVPYEVNHAFDNGCCK